MKKLILVRHAKSSWQDVRLRDIERPLNKRGDRDARFMSGIISEKGIIPELLVASPSERTTATARIFAPALNYAVEKIMIDDRIYLADSDELLEVVQGLNNTSRSVFLFGHNPGITDFFNLLTGSFIEKIPTCGTAGLEYSGDNWTKLTPGSCGVLFFEYPKKYSDR